MTEERLRELLDPFLSVDGTPRWDVPSDLYTKLSVYLDLLVRWNSRTNLTAVRDAEDIVTRHFGEGLFAASVLRPHLPQGASLLDFGSGAGFPGLPIQLALPDIAVTLAESQGKKAAFLREAVRSLGLKTHVWAKRVEEMPREAAFDVVTLRAVDRMEEAVRVAVTRLLPGGFLAELVTGNSQAPPALARLVTEVGVPRSTDRVLRLWQAPQESSSTWNTASVL